MERHIAERVDTAPIRHQVVTVTRRMHHPTDELPHRADARRRTMERHVEGKDGTVAGDQRVPVAPRFTEGVDDAGVGEAVGTTFVRGIAERVHRSGTVDHQVATSEGHTLDLRGRGRFVVVSDRHRDAWRREGRVARRRQPHREGLVGFVDRVALDGDANGRRGSTGREAKRARGGPVVSAGVGAAVRGRELDADRPPAGRRQLHRDADGPGAGIAFRNTSPRRAQGRLRVVVNDRDGRGGRADGRVLGPADPHTEGLVGLVEGVTQDLDLDLCGLRIGLDRDGARGRFVIGAGRGRPVDGLVLDVDGLAADVRQAHGHRDGLGSRVALGRGLVPDRHLGRIVVVGHVDRDLARTPDRRATRGIDEADGQRRVGLIDIVVVPGHRHGVRAGVVFKEANRCFCLFPDRNIVDLGHLQSVEVTVHRDSRSHVELGAVGADDFEGDLLVVLVGFVNLGRGDIE